MIEKRTTETKLRRNGRSGSGGIVLVSVLLVGCASSGPTAASRGPEGPRIVGLELDDPATWSEFEVKHNSFGKRIELRDLTSGEARSVRYKGIPTSWMNPLNLVVDARIYERRRHRVAYRFDDPWSGRELVLRARGTSQHVGTVPVPLHDESVELEVAIEGSETPFARIAYRPGEATLFAGEVEGRPLRIETLDGSPPPRGGVRELLLGSFPLSGRYSVRGAEGELARFVQLPTRGTVSSYELALPRESGAEARYDAWLAFFVFDLMKEFVHSVD